MMASSDPMSEGPPHKKAKIGGDAGSLLSFFAGQVFFPLF
jgi:hypothetical protein